ncbi:hypothetical protein B7R22_17420 [Subtercola boreus]|uniref:HTH marR-type domain-containing protein n=1 Tax=Subtercola boreus TaxID=120213 RepID=A0A3E0VQP4_9MICO|nr:MarR family transcriptional regulator [Subtercola boreus]RFA12206.1 hypothetical protein B7R22_17420 [Subtercola boreus]
MNEQADQVWASMLAVVTHNLEGYRRLVSDEVGLSFSRVRVIRRLSAAPLTMGGLAEAAGMDAPAASVAVNELERRGLVARATDPANRRVRMVALTTEGRLMLERVHAVRPVAPPEFEVLGAGELEQLAGILSRLEEEAA